MSLLLSLLLDLHLVSMDWALITFITVWFLFFVTNVTLRALSLLPFFLLFFKGLGTTFLFIFRFWSFLHLLLLLLGRLLFSLFWRWDIFRHIWLFIRLLYISPPFLLFRYLLFLSFLPFSIRINSLKVVPIFIFTESRVNLVWALVTALKEFTLRLLLNRNLLIFRSFFHWMSGSQMIIRMIGTWHLIIWIFLIWVLGVRHSRFSLHLWISSSDPHLWLLCIHVGMKWVVVLIIITAEFILRSVSLVISVILMNFVCALRFLCCRLSKS